MATNHDLTPKRGFGSDNHSGVHPKILEAIIDANTGHAPAYQTDDLSSQMRKKFTEVFPGLKDVSLCFTGTAANVIGLSLITKPYQTVLVSSFSHLDNDECGAPERNLGLKLKPVFAKDAKLTPELLAPFIIRKGDQHFSQVAAISVTQPTEIGTVYSLSELQALVDFAKKNKLRLHMDGTRLPNSVLFLNCSFADVVKGFDVVSFGGTKNGLLGTEAVLVFTETAEQEIKFSRKQLMQLPSKTRFMAAQYLAYFKDDLWREIAQKSCDKARALRQAIEDKTDWQITQKTESNAVFVQIPKDAIKALKEKSFFYVWDEATFECRLMTSFDTELFEIENFLS